MKTVAQQLLLALIPLPEVSRVNLVYHIVENAVVAIGDNYIACFLKRGKVVDDAAALECIEGTGGFVYDNLDSASPKLLDDIECRALPEVVGTTFHGEAECADDLRLHCQNLIDDKLFARAVGIDDGANQVLGNVLEVGEELLGILGQAVPAVAEAGVVVMGPDARVQADSLDNVARVEALALGIGVELVEVRNPQRQIRVGKELDGFRFR